MHYSGWQLAKALNCSPQFVSLLSITHTHTHTQGLSKLRGKLNLFVHFSHFIAYAVAQWALLTPLLLQETWRRQLSAAALWNGVNQEGYLAQPRPIRLVQANWPKNKNKKRILVTLVKERDRKSVFDVCVCLSVSLSLVCLCFIASNLFSWQPTK